MRFSLAKLLLAVTLAALACAAMTLHTRWWAEGMVALTVALFAVVAIRAVGLRGRDRAFAIAFSVTGFTYLLLMGSPFFPHVQQYSLTSHLLYRLSKAMHVVDYDASNGYAPAAYNGPPLNPYSGTTTVLPAPALTAPAMATPQLVAPPTTAAPPATIPSNYGGAPSAPPTSDPAVPLGPSGIVTLTPNSTPSIYIPAPSAEIEERLPPMEDAMPASRFLLIGHCAWSWLLALLAGWFCGYVYLKRETAKV